LSLLRRGGGGTILTDFVREFLKDPRRRAERLQWCRWDAWRPSRTWPAPLSAWHEAAFINGVALPVAGGSDRRLEPARRAAREASIKRGAE